MNTETLINDFIKNLRNRGMTFISDGDNEIRDVLLKTVVNPMQARMNEIMHDYETQAMKSGLLEDMLNIAVEAISIIKNVTTEFCIKGHAATALQQIKGMKK